MSRMMQFALMSVLVFGTAVCLAGGEDTGYLSGTVISLETGELVEGALVFVKVCDCPEDIAEGGMQGYTLYSDTTDADGYFFIEGIPAGEWQAKARKQFEGHDQETVLIEAGIETVVTFELEVTGDPGGLMYRLQYHGGE